MTTELISTFHGDGDEILEVLVFHIAKYADDYITSHNAAVAMSSADGLVGTGFTSRYRLQPRVGL